MTNSSKSLIEKTLYRGILLMLKSQSAYEGNRFPDGKHDMETIASVNARMLAKDIAAMGMREQAVDASAREATESSVKQVQALPSPAAPDVVERVAVALFCQDCLAAYDDINTVSEASELWAEQSVEIKDGWRLKAKAAIAAMGEPPVGLDDNLAGAESTGDLGAPTPSPANYLIGKCEEYCHTDLDGRKVITLDDLKYVITSMGDASTRKDEDAGCPNESPALDTSPTKLVSSEILDNEASIRAIAFADGYNKGFEEAMKQRLPDPVSGDESKAWDQRDFWVDKAKATESRLKTAIGGLRSIAYGDAQTWPNCSSREVAKQALLDCGGEKNVG